MELIDCINPQIYRNPLFNQYVQQGFSQIYLQDSNTYLNLTQQQITLAYNNEYVAVDTLKLKYVYNLPFEYDSIAKHGIRRQLTYKQYGDIFKKNNTYKEDTQKIITYYKRLYIKELIGDKYYFYNNYYLFNPSTGELIKVYQLSECCKCNICQEKRKNILLSRLTLHSAIEQTPPILLTLTYNQPNYDIKKEYKTEKQTKDIQDFLKLLRYYISYYDKNIQIKYVCCSEFGSNRGRLHYHLIIYGIPQNSFFRDNYMPKNAQERFNYSLKINESLTINIAEFVYKAWKSKGKIRAEISRDMIGAYSAKYIGKPAKEIGKKTISLKSIRLGLDYLQKNINPSKDTYIEKIKVPYEKYDFKKNTYIKKIKEIPLYRYIGSYLFPNINQLIPKGLRDNLQYIKEHSKYAKGIINLIGIHPRTDLLFHHDNDTIKLMAQEFDSWIGTLENYESIVTYHSIYKERSRYKSTINYEEYKDVDLKNYILNIKNNLQKQKEKDLQ